jgi:hypothetical protein
MGSIDTSEIEQLIENLSKQEVIELFNEYIYDLLKQLSTIANDPDINWAYNGVKDYTKLNQTGVINQFNIYVLEYYEKIINKDVKFFLNEKTTESKLKESFDITKIFKFKKLFLQLSKDQQDTLFYNLAVLCKISARYFVLSN